MELPVVVPKYSPKPLPSDIYYRIPVRTIYKSYPIYAPGRAPSSYLDKLKTLEPQIAFDPAQLHTKDEWIRAGELVFTAGAAYNVPMMDFRAVTDPAWYARIRPPLTKDGIMPYMSYVIRQKGKVEVAALSCANCHTRVLRDGKVLLAGPGDFPLDRVNALTTTAQSLAEARRNFLALFAIPWLPARQKQFESYSLKEMVEIYDSIPGGVLGRNRTSPFFPTAVPDLRGVRDRRYLDKSGLNQHRGIADLMRYAAMAEGIEFFSSFDGFIPFGGDKFDTVPNPDSLERFGEQQLYALALWLYSLEPPTNLSPPDASLARQGQHVFEREGCGGCHTPPLYTNNKLTPAAGFTIPEDHRSRYDILPVVVGSDPTHTLEPRRGTGYYKVPSLRGVWYRGPFEHNGSVATLEDWFDPQRLRTDYVPTGFRGYHVRTRAVPGHSFGLKLSSDDRKALIAFLKTL
jgi:hypothetical protein